MFFFFKQKTAYEMRISDWSSDVCSSDLRTEYLAEDRRTAGRRACPGFEEHRAAAFPGHESGMATIERATSLAGPILVAPTAARAEHRERLQLEGRELAGGADHEAGVQYPAAQPLPGLNEGRSEERRVGYVCVRPCSSRWSPYAYKKKNNSYLD